MSGDEGEENPGPKPKRTDQKTRRDRLQRVRSAANSATASLQAPRFKVPGRPRLLDPSQDVLDKNVKTILGAGAMNCTHEETAALHDVGVETLHEFFARYPEIKTRFEEAKLTGFASVKRNQFNQSATSPQMAIHLGQQFLGQRDPHKVAELDLRERQFAENIRLENEKLALRERDVAAKERLLEMRAPADLGSGLPIDIKSLSLPQLMQLLDRVRAMQSAGPALTIDAVASREPVKSE